MNRHSVSKKELTRPRSQVRSRVSIKQSPSLHRNALPSPDLPRKAPSTTKLEGLLRKLAIKPSKSPLQPSALSSLRNATKHFKVGSCKHPRQVSRASSKKPSADLDSSQEMIGFHRRTASNELEAYAQGKDQIILKIRQTIEKTGQLPETNQTFYRLGRALGTGAFGRVYMGVHRLTGLKVAIKTVDKQQLKEKQVHRKVSQEVFIMNRVHHSNIVRLLEVFESPRNIFIVMEYVGGGDLLQWLKTREKLPEPEARRIFVQLLDAVAACHSKNIAHRDIKLDNVLLNSDFTQIKLCDFGVSRMVLPNERLTDQCGTPAYLAPEIILNKGYEPLLADLWSLGVLLYALVCGMMPFRAKSLEELHQLILNCEFTVPAFISEECQDLIVSLINPVPHQRLPLVKIKEHPWLLATEECIGRRHGQQFVGKHERVTARMENHRELLKELGDLGIPQELLIQSLRFKENNHATATYHLLDLYKANKLSFL